MNNGSVVPSLVPKVFRFSDIDAYRNSIRTLNVDFTPLVRKISAEQIILNLPGYVDGISDFNGLHSSVTRAPLLHSVWRLPACRPRHKKPFVASLSTRSRSDLAISSSRSARGGDRPGPVPPRADVCL